MFQFTLIITGNIFGSNGVPSTYPSDLHGNSTYGFINKTTLIIGFCYHINSISYIDKKVIWLYKFSLVRLVQITIDLLNHTLVW